MALNLQDKQAIVAEVNEAAKGALSAVIADSRGVTVDKMTELRKAAREAGVTMRVVRNTLLRRAVEGTQVQQHVCSKILLKQTISLKLKVQPLKVRSKMLNS